MQRVMGFALAFGLLASPSTTLLCLSSCDGRAYPTSEACHLEEPAGEGPTLSAVHGSLCGHDAAPTALLTKVSRDPVAQGVVGTVEDWHAAYIWPSPRAVGQADALPFLPHGPSRLVALRI